MDIHTLHVEHVALLLVYTLIAAANSWVYRGMKGIHWFSLYNFLLLLGALSVALRGVLPDIFSIVVGNLFVVVGYAALFVSVAQLFGCERWQYYAQAGLILVATVAMVQTGVVHPRTSTRLIAYSVILCCQQLQITFLLFRKPRGLRDVALDSLGLMLAGLSLSNIVRLAGVAWQGAPQDYLRSGPFLAWVLVVNSALQCGAIVAYVWLTASLLRLELAVQAATDPLTGLLNRRAFEEAFEKQFARCRATNAAISAIIVDMDSFKQINDTFGHHCGDATLIAVAKRLQQHMRKGDSLARIGGDEFAVVLPNSSLADAEEIAERLRRSIEEVERGEGAQRITVTASFGVAERGASTESWEKLSIDCDKALYRVKRRGGNAVQLDRARYLGSNIDGLTAV